MDPWREEAHRDVMLMLALTGQRSAAMAQYEKCSRILAEDLAANPSAETTALYYRIRSEDIQGKYEGGNSLAEAIRSAQQANLLGPSSPLKLCSAQAPRVLSPSVEKLTQLSTLRPTQSEQESEFLQILNRLANPACRLLTLIGPNHQVQKRLLHRVLTTSAAAFQDGIYLITACQQTENALLPTIMQSLGFTVDTPGQENLQMHDEGTSLWLFKQIRDKEMLLVFDTIEPYHGSLHLFEQLLKRAPMLKILVSACAPLNISFEWLFDIY
ncbi:MAG: bacterial transcriptional activator domain-containing protein [Caldilineaceae bacterium]